MIGNDGELLRRGYLEERCPAPDAGDGDRIVCVMLLSLEDFEWLPINNSLSTGSMPKKERGVLQRFQNFTEKEPRRDERTHVTRFNDSFLRSVSWMGEKVEHG